ncbi:hypothetical protein ANN_27431 [Periplaneta americana]|uniref:Uncharacterized protein n=1 Tax=Periplaneta americana TaxID=6978 RepID=A0ABQ8RW83_PERAM|nr:hypothetical protein ANN_27431 [Periplaneta americana]
MEGQLFMIPFDGSLATSLFGKVRGLLFNVVGGKWVEWTLRLLSSCDRFRTTAWPQLLFARTQAPGLGLSIQADPSAPVENHAATAAPLGHGPTMLQGAVESTGIHQPHWAVPQLTAAADTLHGTHAPDLWLSVQADPSAPAEHHATTAAPFGHGPTMLHGAVVSTGIHQPHWAAPQLTAATDTLHSTHAPGLGLSIQADPSALAEHHAAITAAPLGHGPTMLHGAVESTGIHQPH